MEDALREAFAKAAREDRAARMRREIRERNLRHVGPAVAFVEQAASDQELLELIRQRVPLAWEGLVKMCRPRTETPCPSPPESSPAPSPSPTRSTST